MGSSIVLGGLTWRALQKERKLRYFEQKESNTLIRKRLAHTTQQSIQKSLQTLLHMPLKGTPRRWVQKLQKQFSSSAWLWHAVWLNKEGELIEPSIPWRGKDDRHAQQLANSTSCSSFLRAVEHVQIGSVQRLSIAQQLLKTSPSCPLWSWVRVALLHDTHMRKRSHRRWRFSSIHRDGFWLLQGTTYVMLLRPHPKGWLGLVIRLHSDLLQSFPHRWKAGLQSAWLAQQSSLLTQKNEDFTPLLGALSGYVLYTQSKRDPAHSSWLLMSLVILCIVFACLASLLILWMLYTQQRAMDMREELFASVTHELKTPIAAQLALLDTWVRTPLSKQQQQTYFIALRKEIQRLRRLIDTILALQRGEFSRPTYRHIDLTAMCNALLEEFEDQAWERGIELQCDERTPYFVFVDPGGLELAFRHIIDNAIKYSHANGWICLTCIANTQTITWKIQDSGPGIDVAHRASIWEPFIRGDERNISGSGLGLYLAQRMIRRNKGTLRLCPTPEKGTFSIRLTRSYPKGHS